MESRSPFLFALNFSDLGNWEFIEPLQRVPAAPITARYISALQRRGRLVSFVPQEAAAVLGLLAKRFGLHLPVRDDHSEPPKVFAGIVRPLINGLPVRFTFVEGERLSQRELDNSLLSFLIHRVPVHIKPVQGP